MMKLTGFGIEAGTPGLFLRCPGWEKFALGHLLPALCLDGKHPEKGDLREISPSRERRWGSKDIKKSGRVEVRFGFRNIFEMELQFKPLNEKSSLMKSRGRNLGNKPIILNRVSLLETSTSVSLGKNPDRIRIMEQSAYRGKISSLVELRNKTDKKMPSDSCWLVYDSEAKMGFLAGFITSERWSGQIEMTAGSSGIEKWSIGFDGGDLLVKPEERLDFEEVIFLTGKDPHQLLELYAEEVKKRHHVTVPGKVPVSWCSWYPYRLGVSEERILANAEIAAKRLKPLGLSIMEADLGWEKGNLPSSFEENDRFPHGLKWLSRKLKSSGLDLGIWKAPYTISEFDPVVKEHPEYLIQDENGKPASYWTWFWEPHGQVFILDLTQPGAQKWLKKKVDSLRERGVKYFKADFIGCAGSDLSKRRHNRQIVAGGGVESARIGAEIIRKSLPEALILNCGGPEMPGKGCWPLLYTCQDTGNTGFLTYDFHRENYQSLACHLFKNFRWGILQPSCLCVGLPGTLEEARIRAAAAFLTGGQIDISDNLCRLPEDRWEVLTKTLPPLGITAKVIDLFEPITSDVYEYSMTSKKPEEARTKQEHTPGSVWHLRIKQEWDSWDLVGIFELESHLKNGAETTESGRFPQSEISRFPIPLEKLNLDPEEKYWAYEFWSGQFSGAIPGKERNPNGYIHPGDYQDLIAGDIPGFLDVAFFGPAVKLISLRKVRSHPWVVGTTFHQSTGTELKNVEWDKKNRQLRGELHRPAGEPGSLVFYSSGHPIVSATTGGTPALCYPGANGAWHLPIVTRSDKTFWSVKFREMR